MHISPTIRLCVAPVIVAAIVLSACRSAEPEPAKIETPQDAEYVLSKLDPDGDGWCDVVMYVENGRVTGFEIAQPK